MSSPFVGLKTAMMLWVPITVPSGGVIPIVWSIDVDDEKEIQVGRSAAPVPSSHYSEVKAPVSTHPGGSVAS